MIILPTMNLSTNADILAKILKRKQEELTEKLQKATIEDLRSQAADAESPRGFFRAISSTVENGQAAIIAEIKKASPSKGVIREDFDPARIAKSYELGGATCLSVLTDEDFFQGSDMHLKNAKQGCGLPILRKDFIVDAYQVYEARAIGSDCILLIVAALTDTQLQDLSGITQELGMDVLVEIHNREELERGMMLRTPLIGINNRDLHTFKTDLNTTIGLLTDVFPDRMIVTESGIHSREDVALMRKNNVNAFLVGEIFMSAKNPGDKLKELFG